MLSRVWASLILISATIVMAGTLFPGLFPADTNILQNWVEALFEMSDLSIDIALGLVGALCFWMGIFQIAQASGLINVLGRMLEPLLIKLMPSVPKGHPSIGAMTMNIAANVFGLDNAATPMGLKAMEDLQTLNPDKKQISDAQLLFVVLNTTSVTLLPVTIIMYRIEMGAAQASDVLLPIILATSCSSLAGVAIVAWKQKLKIWSWHILIGLFAYVAVLTTLFYFSSQSPSMLGKVGPMILLLTVSGILLHGLKHKVDVYEEFITGAKEGFGLAVKIMPYLVAMLVAVGLVRASGALDFLLNGLSWCLAKLHIGDDFVGALPTAFMKPFSGSGARALMLETMQHYGVDSIQGRIAAVMQGSTETTFYVLSVYLGAVGLQRSRYLISACLTADVVGCTAAIIFTKMLF